MLSPLARLRRDMAGGGACQRRERPGHAVVWRLEPRAVQGKHRARFENETATLENCHLRPTTYFLTSCLQGPLWLADVDAETPETGNRIHYFDRVSRCQGP